MNEEQVKQVVKMMGDRFVGTKQEHQIVDAVVKMLCETLKVNAPKPTETQVSPETEMKG
jgi:hypothetical protein